jgi:hypothetical protein
MATVQERPISPAGGDSIAALAAATQPPQLHMQPSQQAAPPESPASLRRASLRAASRLGLAQRMARADIESLPCSAPASSAGSFACMPELKPSACAEGQRGIHTNTAAAPAGALSLFEKSLMPSAGNQQFKAPVAPALAAAQAAAVVAAPAAAPLAAVPSQCAHHEAGPPPLAAVARPSRRSRCSKCAVTTVAARAALAVRAASGARGTGAWAAGLLPLDQWLAVYCRRTGMPLPSGAVKTVQGQYTATACGSTEPALVLPGSTTGARDAAVAAVREAAVALSETAQGAAKLFAAGAAAPQGAKLGQWLKVAKEKAARAWLNQQQWWKRQEAETAAAPPQGPRLAAGADTEPAAPVQGGTGAELAGEDAGAASGADLGAEQADAGAFASQAGAGEQAGAGPCDAASAAPEVSTVDEAMLSDGDYEVESSRQPSVVWAI